MTNMMADGKSEKIETGQEETWVFKGQKVTVFGRDAEMRDRNAEMRFALDPDESPSTIDLIMIKSDGEDLAAKGEAVVMPAIYSLEGDTLTVCVSAEDDRPTKFDGRYILMGFNRVAAEPQPATPKKT